MKGLTPRQYEILNFIQQYVDDNNFSPSYREIAQYFGFQSMNAVHKHISTLKKKGALTQEHYTPRSIALPEKQKGGGEGELSLPFVGFIQAHMLIETFARSQTMAVPKLLVHNPDCTYVLRVRGDGFIDEQISQGDLLIVEGRSYAEHGETIIAVASGTNTMIKKYYPEDDHIRLMGNTPHIKPLLFREQDIMIQGVVTGLLRLY